MKVKILRLKDKKIVDAEIKKAESIRLPDIRDGWRFNFRKHSKDRLAQTYILIDPKEPLIIQGCLIFKLENQEPYMSYIETAPHNQGKGRKYDLVAGCLIAYACKLSFIQGEGHFKGWLAFDVLEENKEDEIKLMAVYCKKYGALVFEETTLVITPEAGEKLIDEFLN